jgi:ABC-2 type transport system ATP-binding protein
MTEVIKVTNLTKEFKAKQKEAGLKGSIKSLFAPKYKFVKAVNNISFTVNKGEIVGFIGPNGAGKSTTIKMMTGILFPDRGEISVLNFNPQKQRKKLAYEIGTVFGQKPQLWYHLPAIDTFNLFSKIYDLDSETYKRRLGRLTRIFQIRSFIKQPVRKLSLGQRMRCELIASLLHKPKVIFLDEPTIGMDIVAKKRIRELIKKLNQDEEVTIVLTSHDLEDVEKVCTRLIIINEGKIVYDGSTRKLREKHLKYKVIKVILQEKGFSLKLKLRNIKTIYKGKFKHIIEVDTTKHSIQKVVKKIVSENNVADITILDPPIEEIISRIYNKEV